MNPSRRWLTASAFLLSFLAPITAFSQDKPNILVIFGDDVGIADISAYTDGLMGLSTPNIDRIGNEGAIFMHYYAEQSCTAGRNAFFTACIRCAPA